MPNIKLKAWGEFSKLSAFRKEMESSFLCFTSKLRESDQGGFHLFIDVVVEEDWREDQPTAKQLRLMDDLGIAFDETTTKGYAFDRIATVLRGLKK